MKCKHTYFAPQLRLEAYKKALDKQMRESLALGLAAWLEAVTAVVPVWSGASRATFLKVAAEIGYPISSVAPDGMGGGVGVGQEMSTGKLEANDKDSGVYTFTYGTTLPWLIWNEYHNANTDPDPTLFARLKNPGPYHFQVKGVAAFLHATGTVDLPAVTPFMTKRRVR